MKKLSLSFMLLLASPTFTANGGLSDWYNGATSYANTAYSYAGQLASMAKDVAQTTYNAAYQAYENSHISEYATSTYNTVYNWASENISHLSAATKDKARTYLQSKAVDLMGKYTVKLVDKKVDRLLYDLVYKQNGVHVEDADGNIIGHIYNDNANFLRNFAAKFGVDLNTLVPYIPGQKALWNFIENRFFKLTLLN
ncbi:MAG: hypothetical protein Q8K37_02130, partial [Alphaproteobacteria bacterium]|nr:hypothetical protein [Alphaproteobacteria bacterium]